VVTVLTFSPVADHGGCRRPGHLEMGFELLKYASVPSTVMQLHTFASWKSGLSSWSGAAGRG
jgi:hypothetical protein